MINYTGSGKKAEYQLQLMTIDEASEVGEEYCRRHFPKRLERSRRFRYEEDRLRCIGAGYLLQELLGAREELLCYNAHGKPYLSGDDRKFSISHSGKYIAIAVSAPGEQIAEIGVDIEEHREKNLKVAKSAKSFFTGEEQDWMQQDPIRRFHQIWTMKEAVMKADGRGLAMNFRDSVLPLLEGRELITEKHIFQGETLLLEGYGLSVCRIRNR